MINDKLKATVALAVRNLNQHRMQNIFLNLTYKCPLACKYCYVQQQSRPDMTFEEADYIVNELTKNPNNIAHAITFFGGEPALKLDLIEKLLDKYSSRGTKFFIITSFTVNRDKVLELAEKHPNFEITVSYDSPENEQRVYHNGKPIDLSDADFPRMKKAGVNLLKVVSGQEKNLTADLNSYLDLLIKYDIYGDLSEVKTPAAGIDYRELEDAYYQYAYRVIGEYFSGRLKFIPKHFMMYMCRIVEHDQDNMGECGLLQDIFISADGSMSPCSIANTEPELQLIDDESYNTVASAGQQYMVGKCRDCLSRYFCPGGCLVDRKRTTGDFKEPNPAWCEYIKAIERGCRRVFEEMDYEDIMLLIDEIYKWRTRIYEPCIEGKRMTELR